MFVSLEESESTILLFQFCIDCSKCFELIDWHRYQFNKTYTVYMMPHDGSTGEWESAPRMVSELGLLRNRFRWGGVLAKWEGPAGCPRHSFMNFEFRSHGDWNSSFIAILPWICYWLFSFKFYIEGSNDMHFKPFPCHPSSIERLRQTEWKRSDAGGASGCTRIQIDLKQLLPTLSTFSL